MIDEPISKVYGTHLPNSIALEFTETEPPSIGAFNTGLPLTLRKVPNGGWVISQGPEQPGLEPTYVGAYSNPKDMLAALSGALITGDKT